MNCTITERRRVVIGLGELGGTEELSPPSYRVRKELFRNIPRAERAVMYYFLVKVLDLPDDAMMTKMVVSLVRRGIAPEMLCLADLKQLSLFVRNLGRKGVERLEQAIRSYK